MTLNEINIIIIVVVVAIAVVVTYGKASFRKSFCCLSFTLVYFSVYVTAYICAYATSWMLSQRKCSHLYMYMVLMRNHVCIYIEYRLFIDLFVTHYFSHKIQAREIDILLYCMYVYVMYGNFICRLSLGNVKLYIYMCVCMYI